MKSELTPALGKISKYLLVAAAALLIVRNEQVWLLKPFEILLLASATMALFYFFPRRAYLLKLVDKRIYITLSVFLLSLLVATAVSYFRYGVKFDLLGYYGESLYFLRFLGVIAVFLLIHIYAKEDPAFFRLSWLALLSPLLFLPALIFPDWAHRSEWFLGNGRFYGFAEPTFTATSVLATFALLWAAFLNAFQKRQASRAVLYFALSAIGGAFLLWTQTRGHWLGMGVAAFGAAAAAAWYSREAIWKKFFMNAALTAAVFAASFLILPISIKSAVILRVYPQYTTEYWSRGGSSLTTLTASDLRSLINEVTAGKAATAKEIMASKAIAAKEAAPPVSFSSSPLPASLSKLLGQFQDSASWLSHNELRPTIWREYWGIFLRNPLGIGISRMAPEMLTAMGTNQRSPHDTPLDIAAWGGVATLGSAIYLGWLVVVALKKKLAAENGGFSVYSMGIAAALAGLFVASLFDTLTLHKPIWILLALALA